MSIDNKCKHFFIKYLWQEYFIFGAFRFVCITVSGVPNIGQLLIIEERLLLSLVIISGNWEGSGLSALY